MLTIEQSLNLNILSVRKTELNNCEISDIFPFICFDFYSSFDEFLEKTSFDNLSDVNYFLNNSIIFDHCQQIFSESPLVRTDKNFIDDELLYDHNIFLDFYKSKKLSMRRTNNLFFNNRLDYNIKSRKFLTLEINVFSKMTNLEYFKKSVKSFLDFKVNKILKNAPVFSFEDKKTFFYAFNNNFSIKDIVDIGKLPQIHEYSFDQIRFKDIISDREVKYFFESKTSNLSFCLRQMNNLTNIKNQVNSVDLHFLGKNELKNFLFFTDKKDAEKYIKSQLLKLNSIINNSFSDIEF